MTPIMRHRAPACYVSEVDPLAGSQWSAPGTVAGFAKSAPNAVLLSFATEELKRVDQRTRARHRLRRRPECGATRAAGLERRRHQPIVAHARRRRRPAREEHVENKFRGILAPMETLPARDRASTSSSLTASGISRVPARNSELRTRRSGASRDSPAGPVSCSPSRATRCRHRRRPSRASLSCSQNSPASRNAS